MQNFLFWSHISRFCLSSPLLSLLQSEKRLWEGDPCPTHAADLMCTSFKQFFSAAVRSEGHPSQDVSDTSGIISLRGARSLEGPSVLLFPFLAKGNGDAVGKRNHQIKSMGTESGLCYHTEPHHKFSFPAPWPSCSVSQPLPTPPTE